MAEYKVDKIILFFVINMSSLVKILLKTRRCYRENVRNRILGTAKRAFALKSQQLNPL